MLSFSMEELDHPRRQSRGLLRRCCFRFTASGVFFFNFPFTCGEIRVVPFCSGVRGAALECVSRLLWNYAVCFPFLCRTAAEFVVPPPPLTPQSRRSNEFPHRYLRPLLALFGLIEIGDKVHFLVFRLLWCPELFMFFCILLS